MNIKKKLWFDFKLSLICIPIGIYGFTTKLDLGSTYANPLLVGAGAGIGIVFMLYLVVSWLFFKELNKD